MVKYFIQNFDLEKIGIWEPRRHLEDLWRGGGGVAIHPSNPDLHGSRIMMVIIRVVIKIEAITGCCCYTSVEHLLFAK